MYPFSPQLPSHPGCAGHISTYSATPSPGQPPLFTGPGGTQWVSLGGPEATGCSDFPTVFSPHPVPFSLDPNTAAGWLSVSDDLTSVTNHGYRVQVENPERFSSAPCLLGSCILSQGSHAWEVDLGALASWRVGVVRTRQDAGTEGHAHSCYHDTRSGFWYVGRTQGVDGDHCVTSDPAASPLVPAIPRRLRVELECEEGELSFYDAERRCHLYTFHARFGEVRPYFYLGGSRGDGSPEPLRICPLRITIKEELDS